MNKCKCKFINPNAAIKTKQYKASAANHRKSKIFGNLKGADANFAKRG